MQCFNRYFHLQLELFLQLRRKIAALEKSIYFIKHLTNDLLQITTSQPEHFAKF